VQLEYEVDDRGAIVKRELPFVLGVMGDYSGQPKDPLPAVRDRKFVQVDGENFDSVLKGMKPRLQFQVDNTLQNDGTTLKVELNFEKLADFDPPNVAKQVPELNKLIQLRQALNDLRNKMFASDKLEELLADVLENTEKQQQIVAAAGTPAEKADK
jgi:type VI secretion system protein ImpB